MAEEPAPAAAGEASGSAAPAVGGLRPTWLIRVPHTPGLPVLQASVGPVLAGDLAIVGSTALGFAAVEVDTGVVRWQRRGEERPELPHREGARVHLPGACAHLEERPPEAFGCVEIVHLADGTLIERRWTGAPAPPPDLGADVGVAGPIEVAGRLLAVRDGTLEAHTPAGDLAWRSDRRYGHTPGALARAGDQALAFELAAGQIAPVRIDPATGTTRGRAAPVPGIGVLAAAFTPHLAAAALRSDTSLRHDRLALWPLTDLSEAPVEPGSTEVSETSVEPGSTEVSETSVEPGSTEVSETPVGGGAVRVWEVPEPDGRRVEPVGLVAEGRMVIVFFDGRFVGRLELGR